VVGAVIAPPLFDGAHRNTGERRREVSYLHTEVKNLDFTAVERSETLRS
jgi:hypothetical protein